jgi:hypothetical protein
MNPRSVPAAVGAEDVVGVAAVAANKLKRRKTKRKSKKVPSSMMMMPVNSKELKLTAKRAKKGMNAPRSVAVADDRGEGAVVMRRAKPQTRKTIRRSAAESLPMSTMRVTMTMMMNWMAMTKPAAVIAICQPGTTRSE